MSDSIKKWDEKQEDALEERNKVVGQNGNDGLHYEGDYISQIPIADGGIQALEFKPICKIYSLDIDNIKTLEDIKLVLKGLNLSIHSYGSLNQEQQELIDKGYFKLSYEG